MALIPSGTKATHCGALVVWMKVAYLTSLHGLSSHKMALITSDCDAMRPPGSDWPESPRITWAVILHNGPNHLGLRCDAPPGSKWPESPRRGMHHLHGRYFACLQAAAIVEAFNPAQQGALSVRDCSLGPQLPL